MARRATGTADGADLIASVRNAPARQLGWNRAYRELNARSAGWILSYQDEVQMSDAAMSVTIEW
jgi:hypothetical protein